jgi:3-oxoacyl-[acyl-carrier protein] reductase
MVSDPRRYHAGVDLGLNGRVAMVAAGSKGLGLAAARSLVKEGCAVSLCARGAEALDAAKKELLAAAPGAKVAAGVCDVSDAAQLQRWHDETVRVLGEVDVLVTSTGGPPAGRFLELDEAAWRAGVDGTLMNVVRLCKAVIPGMQKRRWGRIVHLTSLVAKQPSELLTVSSTLRAGLSALTKTLATQLAKDNILVNALLPGHVLTDRQLHLNQLRAKERGATLEETMARAERDIPLARFGRPEEIGDVVAFLCSARASYLTGVSLQVDGGIIESTF